MKKYLFVISFLVIAFGVHGQKVKINLISKMDISPQYRLSSSGNDKTMLMGYTTLFGSPIRLPSPTLTFTEGDSVEIHMRNMSQSAPHTIHLHGLDVDQVTDGVPQLSFSIPHDSTGIYAFVAPHPGTYIYHCHVISTIHVQAGMYGVIIVKPKTSNMTWENGYNYDNEKTFMMSELDTNWHTTSVIHMPGQNDQNAKAILPDYNPQYFYINGSDYYHTNGDSELVIGGFSWQTTYLRLVNIGFYGNRFIVPKEVGVKVVSSDGRPLPKAEEFDTLEILPGERYGVLFDFIANGNFPLKMEYFDLNSMEVKAVVEGSYSKYSSLNKFEKQKVEVYPNPAISKVNIKFNNSVSRDLQIDILDLQGRLIKRSIHEADSHLEFSVDTHFLNSGMYLIRINTDSGVQVKKVQIK